MRGSDGSAFAASVGLEVEAAGTVLAQCHRSPGTLKLALIEGPPISALLPSDSVCAEERPPPVLAPWRATRSDLISREGVEMKDPGAEKRKTPERWSHWERDPAAPARPRVRGSKQFGPSPASGSLLCKRGSAARSASCIFAPGIDNEDVLRSLPRHKL
jgi:hypothetical protein